jgi:mannose-1-phosphate guanylyltransferase / mannose-6-phosphate isomerase
VSVIHPVILSGGSGSRLWPVSNSERPKQFLSLIGDESLYASTVARARLFGDLPPTIVTGVAHRDLVGEISPDIGRIVIEPAPRNTAAAIVAAALLCHPDEILAVLPADHLVADADSFADALRIAVDIAEGGGVVTLGVVPTRPETGYGWIKIGEKVEPGAFVIDQFIEKPLFEAATAMLAGGDHYWNSGVFIAKSSEIVEAADRLVPDLLSSVRAAIPDNPGEVVYLTEEFGSVASVSFDTAIMERLSQSYVVPLDAGWSDVGSWVGVWENVDHDSDGNALRGDVVAVDSTNSLIWASDRQIAVVGLEGVVVVETDEGILIAAMDEGQAIRSVADKLREKLGENG